jgi:8-oxo-dGTP diphosphatase
MMDFTYHSGGFYLEIYVGKLNKKIEPKGDENELCWISPDENFFDYSKFAGDGNIGHILRCAEIFEKDLFISYIY